MTFIQSTDSDSYARIIDLVMEIEDVTWGDPKVDYLIRFRGRLKQDLDTARSLLIKEFRSQKIVPLIKIENGRHVVLLVNDPFTFQIEKVFRIDEILWGNEQLGFIAKYRGKLTRDSVEAYDLLAADLKPKAVTPLFRVENNEQVIILVPGVINPTKSNSVVNLVMFVLTVLSVAFVGSLGVLESSLDNPDNIFFELVKNIWRGWPFAVSLLSILLAHEFGHYIAGRIHKTAVTLPYFIPLPLPPFGTLGAFIQLKEPPKNKRVLHDIGVAGPLAGLIVAIPVLLIGLSLSTVDNLPSSLLSQGQGLQLEGNSILYLFAKYLVFGELLPAPANFGDVSPILYWIRYFFTGSPIPLGGRDVLIHPVALAGWGGLLVTSLNLIPAGQLDGGHLIYVLFGHKAKRLLPFILAALFGLGLIWSGWWLWAMLIFFLGRTYAEPLDQITELDSKRKAIAVFGLIIFILVFTPVPLNIIMG